MIGGTGVSGRGRSAKAAGLEAADDVKKTGESLLLLQLLLLVAEVVVVVGGEPPPPLLVKEAHEEEGPMGHFGPSHLSPRPRHGTGNGRRPLDETDPRSPTPRSCRRRPPPSNLTRPPHHTHLQIVNVFKAHVYHLAASRTTSVSTGTVHIICLILIEKFQLTHKSSFWPQNIPTGIFPSSWVG